MRYCIYSGNFGEVFLIWQIGDFAKKLTNLKPTIILLFHTLLLYAEVLAIAKLKICLCIHQI